MKKHALVVKFLIALGVVLASCPRSFAAGLPEFAYREVTLKVLRKDGKPVAGALVYGWCRELKLIWRPGRDHELRGRDDVLWTESYLGKTDSDGSVKATVPPGRWGFFAAGKMESGGVIAAWTDFRERTAGETVRLAATDERHWSLCLEDGTALKVNRIFLKPEGFPIWIPAGVDGASGAVQIEFGAGQFQMWASGDAAADHAGFAMGWGTLSENVADGKVRAVGSPGWVQCKGGKGGDLLHWFFRGDFGLEGDVGLCKDAKVLLTPGSFALSYRRAITSALAGEFVGESYDVRQGNAVLLKMETPLDVGLDQGLTETGRSGQFKLIGQLYLVDGNGHILSGLFDGLNKPVSLGAAVTLNGKQYAARQMLHEVDMPVADEQELSMDAPVPMKFEANVGAIDSDAGAQWDFAAPAGVMPAARLARSELITVNSATFKMDVPRVIAADAQNLLGQADLLAQLMQDVSGRKRRVEPTNITIDARRLGAVSAHNGSQITMGCALFFDDVPVLGHTFVHELGHNFAFIHGGLHETVVEVCRCGGGEQISGQLSKWMFMDRMNGMARKESPYPYPNVGLYLYCYSQGGMRFLRFMSVNEYAVIAKLEKQGYTKDEVTTALLGLALGRDMTRICIEYGLDVTPDRVMEATRVGRVLCRAS